jgi:hypothetical protein
MDLFSLFPHLVRPRYIGMRQHNEQAICLTLAEEISISQFMLEKRAMVFRGGDTIFQ